MEMNEILLTQEAKINFLKGLIRIGKCDGEQDEKELFFYHQATIAMGIEENEREQIDSAWNDDKKIMVEFKESKEKMFFFIQAIQLCWIDGHYTEREKQEIREIAQELGITEDAILEVETWVKEGIEWNNKGEKLLKLK